MFYVELAFLKREKKSIIPSTGSIIPSKINPIKYRSSTL